jgi:hypothetical protein
MSQSHPDVVSMDKAPPVSPELRARVLRDPNVYKIAESMQVPLEEFVNTIGYFMQNPSVEPTLIGATDEALMKRGVAVPSEAKIRANIRETVAALGARRPQSGFSDAKSNPVNLTPHVSIATVSPNAELNAAVKKARGSGKL